MNAVILGSIVLRLIGVGYSGLLLYRSRDSRFGFLTLMLGLMAARQLLSAQSSTTPTAELPGLAVSVLAVLTVYYLSNYVEEERRITDRLRGFRKAVEHAGHAIFLTEPDGTIEYANPAVEEVTGHAPADVVGKDPSLWKSGEHDEEFYAEMWGDITSGNIWDGEIVNQRKSGDLCWVDMTIAPITDGDGEVERFVAVETDVTERKERLLRIEEQNERLELLNDTNAVLRDVNRELVAASTREEVEEAVCERFTASRLFDTAWIGERSIVDGEIDERTERGIDGSIVDAQLEALRMGDPSPVARASEEGVPVFVTAEAVPGANDPGTELAVVPLTYQEANYGVLVVHAQRDDTFDAIDRALFSELGATIADAISATQSRQTLATDDVTELEFRVVDDEEPLIALSASLDCDMELDHVATDSDDRRVLYCTLIGTTPDRVRAYVEETASITDVQHLNAYEDRHLSRLCVDEASIAAVLADYGASIDALVATGGSGRLTAEVSRANDVRTVVEALSATYADIELLARREREHDVETEEEFRSRLEALLTARQLEAARTAYYAGFFEWPRESSGEEVARKMEISQSTFTQHLRRAEKKLFGALFDGPAPGDS